MSEDNHSKALFLLLKGGPQVVIKTVLDLLPCAIGLWSLEHGSCVLNNTAMELTGFSGQEFREDSSLWMSRIHPRDRSLVSTAWKKLQGGEKLVSCDYRFSPKKDEKESWLRDVSVSCQNPQGEVEGIASAYTDISDLKVRRPRSQEEKRGEDVVGIIDGVVHEIQNNLHVISMGLDLLRLSRTAPQDCGPVVRGIERTNKSLKELREYFLPPESEFSTENPAIILEEVVGQMERELHRQGVRFRAVRPGPLPLVRLDLKQFRSALERVIEFSRALLPEGGELEIEAGLQEIGGERYVELKVASSSATSLGVEEKDVFRPFLRVNDHQVGLGITLAHQILRRHQGNIFFQMENPQRGLFTILLKVRSDEEGAPAGSKRKRGVHGFIT